MSSSRNVSSYFSENWPTVKSEFIEAYEFEVFDFAKTLTTLSQLRSYLFGLCAVYVGLVFLGKAWMRDREPYRLQGALVLWNVSLAIFSIVSFLRCWPEFWYVIKQPSGFYISLCTRDVHNYAMAFWVLMFLLSKILEFGDTAFIVLRKQKLIFLHWYHHTVTLLLGYFLYESYDPSTRYYVIMNAFIHSLMYSYYALKALKVKVPLKIAKVITTLQLAQMMVILGINLYTAYILKKGIPCDRTAANVKLTLLVGATFFLLFSNFFTKRYGSSRQELKKAN